eukprot:scaffold305713_cov31-Tisochrysis_lutea.AAC.3
MMRRPLPTIPKLAALLTAIRPASNGLERTEVPEKPRLIRATSSSPIGREAMDFSLGCDGEKKRMDRETERERFIHTRRDHILTPHST